MQLKTEKKIIVTQLGMITWLQNRSCEDKHS